MLNVFDYYDEPKDLNKSELYDSIALLDKLSKGLVSPIDKESLAPVYHIIKKQPLLASMYAIKVLQHNWSEMEDLIKTNAQASLLYTINILNKNKTDNLIRWKEAEPVIMKEAPYAISYAINILKDRWHEAEKYIKKDQDWSKVYQSKFKIKEW
jgi:hypothetical protein